MLAKFERRAFTEGCKVWLGKYRSLHNIPHWHYEHELVSCLEGSAAVLLDGKQYRLETGELARQATSVRRKAPTLSPAALTAV